MNIVFYQLPEEWEERERGEGLVTFIWTSLTINGSVNSISVTFLIEEENENIINKTYENKKILL